MNKYILLILFTIITISSCTSQFEELAPCELITTETVISIVGVNVSDISQPTLTIDGKYCTMYFEDNDGDDYVLDISLKQSEDVSDPILSINTHFPGNFPQSEAIPNLGDKATFFLTADKVQAIVVNKSYYTYGILFSLGQLTDIEKRDIIIEICESINAQLK